MDKTEVMQNRKFEVHCNFTGNPAPDFVVMNNNTKRVDIFAHGASNVIDSILEAQCEDAGLWMCTGRNYLNYGENATRTANLTVLCKYTTQPENVYTVKNSEYDEEIPQSQTADKPVAPQGRAAQPSRNTRKTN